MHKILKENIERMIKRAEGQFDSIRIGAQRTNNEYTLVVDKINQPTPTPFE